jgi:spore maturation protein CgeB
MRVFCAIRHSNDPRQYYGDLWSANFYPALRELGHEVIESQVDLLPTSSFMSVGDDFRAEELDAREKTTESILAEVRTASRERPVDLFLSYFYNSHFDPAGFDELRRLGIPSVNFYCNSTHQFELVSAIAAKADFAWHSERDAREKYLAIDARPVWVQLGADPNLYHPTNERREAKACFIGQRYADRDRLAAALIRGGVELDLYGSGWGQSNGNHAAVDNGKHSHLGRAMPRPGSLVARVQVAGTMLRSEGLVRGARRLGRQLRYRKATRRLDPILANASRGRANDVPDVFARYEVVLNFSNVWADARPCSKLIPHVRLRDFEGPMCRTCYLTGHTDEIEAFYDVGAEIDTYRSSEELVDKTRFYLQNPAAAESLREAGYRRARRDHTWKRRFEDLFSKIGLCRN